MAKASEEESERLFARGRLRNIASNIHWSMTKLSTSKSIRNASAIRCAIRLSFGKVTYPTACRNACVTKIEKVQYLHTLTISVSCGKAWLGDSSPQVLPSPLLLPSRDFRPNRLHTTGSLVPRRSCVLFSSNLTSVRTLPRHCS